MVEPSITDLTKGEFDRYTLAIATAKCARMITDEYVRQREIAEHRIANKETDKSIASMIKKEYRDEKAVKNAITKIHGGEYTIVRKEEIEEASEVAEAEAAETAEVQE